jgi:hypothetical protein
MAKSLSAGKRRMLVDKYLTELSLLAKEICPEAKIEATTETFEDEDGHIRVYPPAGISAEEIEEVEGKIAIRCVDILVEEGISICAAVYD